MDKLTVTGVGKRFDGDYDFDIHTMLIDVGSPNMLTGDEAAEIKERCGAYGYDIARQFLSDDWTVQLAVALVVLARQGLDLDLRQAKALPVGAFRFTLSQEVDEDNPPTEGSSTSSSNGGASGSPTPDGPQANGQASTGHQPSAASSAPATSER